jgi:O-antigen biosynthesis protein WbqV
MAFHFVARYRRVAAVLTLTLVVLDYAFVFIEPKVLGPAVFGRITIILFFFLEVFSLSALRFGYRYFRYSRTRHHARSEDTAPTLLIGRAADAEIVLRGIENGAIKRLWPVGVLSPSAADRGQQIRNIPVLGGVDDIESVIRDFERRERPIKRAIMTPSAFEADAHPEAVLMRAKRLGLIVSRLPSLESGDTPHLTNVAVEDLLLRPSARIDYGRLETLVKGRAVIVTGGGGSIGAEICERVATFGAARLLIIENSEPALYAVTEALAARDTGPAVEGRIADIRDRERDVLLMSEFKDIGSCRSARNADLERDWAKSRPTSWIGERRRRRAGGKW